MAAGPAYGPALAPHGGMASAEGSRPAPIKYDLLPSSLTSSGATQASLSLSTGTFPKGGVTATASGSLGGTTTTARKLLTRPLPSKHGFRSPREEWRDHRRQGHVVERGKRQRFAAGTRKSRRLHGRYVKTTACTFANMLLITTLNNINNAHKRERCGLGSPSPCENNTHGRFPEMWALVLACIVSDKLIYFSLL